MFGCIDDDDNDIDIVNVIDEIDEIDEIQNSDFIYDDEENIAVEHVNVNDIMNDADENEINYNLTTHQRCASHTLNLIATVVKYKIN